MKHFIVAAAATLGLASIVSQPAPAAEVSSKVVRINDLDLNTAAGNAELYKRLRSAAHRVCGSYDPADSSFGLRPILAAGHGRCTQQALVKAVAQINRPAFSAYVASQTPAVRRSWVMAEQ